MNPNEHLLSLASEFIQDNKTSNLICAFAGGSVGRGEADEYSDLDLNFYVHGDDEEHISKNIWFKNCAIQLHIHPLPSVAMIIDNPWDFRFLLEARQVYDPDLVLRELLHPSISFFQSKQGRQLMGNQAIEIVGHRMKWLEVSISNKEWLTSALAVNSALFDSAFGYSYFKYGSLSTGGLFKKTADLKQFQDFRNIYFKNRNPNTDVLLRSLQSYRSYLRNIYPLDFSLEAIQDKLVARKAARHVQLGELENISWQLSGEALWCYLSVANGKTFEQHYNELPEDMQNHLRILGFVPYTEDQILSITTLVKEIVGIITHQIDHF